jgi:hypothetical protein
MPQVVQARCPHCKNLVRIPREWIHQPMRCKHCRLVFQVRRKADGTGTASPGASAPVPVPAQVPRAIPVSPGRVPVPDPQAPFDFTDVPLPVAAAARAKPGGWWKGAVLAAGLCVTAVVLVLAFWDKISGLPGNPTDRATHEPGKKVSIAPPVDRAPAPAAAPKREDKRPREGPEPPKRVEAPGNDPPTKVIDPVKPPTKDPPAKETYPVKPAKAEDPPKTEVPKKVPPKTEIVKPEPPKKAPPPGQELYPRRALAISVSNYLLANPLSYGEPRDRTFPGSSVRVVLDELGRSSTKFPNTQLFELSDAAPRDPHPPVKSVIETAIIDFLTSSRPQDRVILLFASHAVEVGKEAYLVPIAAPAKDADPKSLISLSWLYDRLKECKARQKVLILDVCRFDPARGEERPGSGPMGEVLDARLRQPPDGVQVWCSCVKGQQAYEFERGSVFLQGLCAAMQERLPGIHEPDEPLPLDVLVPRVNKYLEGVLQTEKLTQTSRLVGTEAKNGAPYDPAQLLAPAVVIKPPPMSPGGLAPTAQVRKILDELKLVPPVRPARDPRSGLTADTLPPFPAKALEPYEADYMSLAEIEQNPEKYPLRVAVLRAAKVLRENVDQFHMKEVFNGNTSAQIKRQVLKEQVDPGKSILFLKDALDDLKKAGEKRDKEPSKRWQANYDFVLARLESRLVYVYEYNHVLAQIRSDSLPPLENGATGYRLGAKKDVGIRKTEPEVKDLLKDIDRTWQRLAKQHPATPWAVVANRERMTVLGLEWRPTRQ